MMNWSGFGERFFLRFFLSKKQKVLPRVALFGINLLGELITQEKYEALSPESFGCRDPWRTPIYGPAGEPLDSLPFTIDVIWADTTVQDSYERLSIIQRASAFWFMLSDSPEWGNLLQSSLFGEPLASNTKIPYTLKKRDFGAGVWGDIFERISQLEKPIVIFETKSNFRESHIADKFFQRIRGMLADHVRIYELITLENFDLIFHEDMKKQNSEEMTETNRIYEVYVTDMAHAFGFPKHSLQSEHRKLWLVMAEEIERKKAMFRWLSENLSEKN